MPAQPARLTETLRYRWHEKFSDLAGDEFENLLEAYCRSEAIPFRRLIERYAGIPANISLPGAAASSTFRVDATTGACFAVCYSPETRDYYVATVFRLNAKSPEQIAQNAARLVRPRNRRKRRAERGRYGYP